ncbi:MAG: BF3164 family lipoprotein [Gemmatimonadota bacterium]
MRRIFGARRRGRRVAAAAVGIVIFAGVLGVRGAQQGYYRLARVPTLGTLHGRLLTDADVLGLPLSIGTDGRRLAVIDGAGEPALHFFRAEDGAFLGSLGRRGDGPCEFRSAISLDGHAGGEGFWVYDLSLARLTHVIREEGSGGWRCDGSLRLDADAVLTGPVWLPRGPIVSLGFQSGGRLAYFDPEGRLLRAVGAIPGLDEDGPANVRQHAYRGELKLKPDGTRLAVGLRHAGEIEIYTPDGRLLARRSGPSEFPPVYAVHSTDHGPTMTTGPRLRFGYVDLGVTDRFIVGLFSGYARGQRPGEAYFGHQIHLFDWDGRYLGAWELDTSLISMTVDARTGRMYGVRHDPVPGILVFQLPAPPEAAPGPAGVRG